MPRQPTFSAVYQSLTYVEDALGELPRNLEEEEIQAVINELENLENCLRNLAYSKENPKKRKLEEHDYTMPLQVRADEESEEVLDKY